MRAAKVQASLRIRAVSPEPPLLAHRSSESRGTFRQKARSLAPLNGWACAVKICHDGMLEDTNSLDGAHMIFYLWFNCYVVHFLYNISIYLVSIVLETINFFMYYCCVNTVLETRGIMRCLVRERCHGKLWSNIIGYRDLAIIHTIF